MKVIDFDKKGNLVRFYLGEDDCEDYHGDDWDDHPYEHNAERVYPEYIAGHCDVVFPFDWAVLEPRDGEINSCWSKDDMKARRVPCIVALECPDYDEEYCFSRAVANDRAVKFYFGDLMKNMPENQVVTLDKIMFGDKTKIFNNDKEEK